MSKQFRFCMSISQKYCYFFPLLCISKNLLFAIPWISYVVHNHQSWFFFFFFLSDLQVALYCVSSNWALYVISSRGKKEKGNAKCLHWSWFVAMYLMEVLEFLDLKTWILFWERKMNFWCCYATFDLIYCLGFKLQ